MYRGQGDGKGAEDGHRDMYSASQHRLYCEAVACDCPAATSSDVPAETAPGDVTSYRTCYARRPKVGGTEHAHDAGTVLTLRCVEEIDASGPCECCHVDARPAGTVNYVTDADGVSAAQMDLLRHNVAAASASII